MMRERWCAFCSPLTPAPFSYLISAKKKSVKHEVAESAQESSRDVAAVQKYLLRAEAHSRRPVISLRAVSSTVPLTSPARATVRQEGMQGVRYTATDQIRTSSFIQERVVLGEDEQPPLDDRLTILKLNMKLWTGIVVL